MNNERVPSAWGGVPYLIHEGTLDECIKQFISKSASQHHLYEIHTRDQPPLVNAVLSNAELIIELARLREFLGKKTSIRFSGLRRILFFSGLSFYQLTHLSNGQIKQATE